MLIKSRADTNRFTRLPSQPMYQVQAHIVRSKENLSRVPHRTSLLLCARPYDMCIHGLHMHVFAGHNAVYESILNGFVGIVFGNS